MRRPSESWAAADSTYSQERRSELVISVGRSFLSSFSLLAIWLDPSEPSRHASAAYTLLAAYVLYAFGVLLFVWSARRAPRGFAVATHALDVLLAALVMFFTEGSTSPFFAYFVFALASASLRWGWKAVLATGAASLFAFLAIGMTSSDFHQSNFELNRFIIRGAYLPVVTTLLAYLGAHHVKLRRELARLAAWPRSTPGEPTRIVESALVEASAMLGAPVVAAVWEESDSGRLHFARWSGGTLEYSREHPDQFEPMVAEPLAETDFLLSPRAGRSEVLFRAETGVGRWHGIALHPALSQRIGSGAVLSLLLSGETFTGRLFVVGLSRPTTDDLELGRIAARQIAADLDQLGLLERLRQSAALEERLRIARDLHDGVLQALAAAGLKLEASVGELREASPEVLTRLHQVQKILVDEQRAMRAISQELKPSPAVRTETDLAARIQEVCERVASHWDLGVEFSCAAPLPPVGTHFSQEICRLVHEALVNAARHGKAVRARVHLRPREDELEILIDDNGKGFSFQGSYHLHELAARKMGPIALRERVTALAGRLRLNSEADGTRLEIGVPLPQERE